VKLVVANWKMNKTREEVLAYVHAFSGRLDPSPGIEISLAPAHPFLLDAGDPLQRWSVAAQDCSAEKSGAFTGEVSASMAASAGCRYVLLGHSERRRLFGEREPLLRRKVARAREAGLVPVYCLGESLEQREEGSTWKVLEAQIEGLAQDPAELPLVVAYEPVWAIGTGRNASPEEAGEAAEYLARLLSRRPHVRLLYGGSVTPENAGPLAGRPGISGFLVGGASLDPADFASICRAAGAAEEEKKSP
jgi:triosephosphate isomerase